MTEAEKHAKCCDLARRLYTSWHSAHGAVGHDEAWDRLDQWDKGYWWNVAMFVYDNFDERVTT